jgi:hypothetical protein
MLESLSSEEKATLVELLARIRSGIVHGYPRVMPALKKE